MVQFQNKASRFLTVDRGNAASSLEDLVMAKSPVATTVAPVFTAPATDTAIIQPVVQAPVVANPYAGMTLEQAIAANYAKMKADKGITSKAKKVASNEPVDYVAAGKRAAATYAERLKAEQVAAFNAGLPLPLTAAEKAVATRHAKMQAFAAAKAEAEAKAIAEAEAEAEASKV